MYVVANHTPPAISAVTQVYSRVQRYELCRCRFPHMSPNRVASQPHLRIRIYVLILEGTLFLTFVFPFVFLLSDHVKMEFRMELELECVTYLVSSLLSQILLLLSGSRSDSCLTIILSTRSTIKDTPSLNDLYLHYEPDTPYLLSICPLRLHSY